MDERLSGKLRILADAAKYDASCASSGAPKRSGGRTGLGSTSNGICHAYTPDGRCVSLLKILLTNYCQFDCAYCINRITSNVARARFRVSEVVNLTLAFYKRNYIEGLFLSSGIIGYAAMSSAVASGVQGARAEQRLWNARLRQADVRLGDRQRQPSTTSGLSSPHARGR